MKIFLSYAGEDNSGIPKQIYDTLTDLFPNFDTFNYLEKSSLRPGQSWVQQISQRIVSCDIFIACLSAEYGQSDNCESELALARENKKIIIPVKTQHVKNHPLLVHIQAIPFYDGDFNTNFATLRDEIERIYQEKNSIKLNQNPDTDEDAMVSMDVDKYAKIDNGELQDEIRVEHSSSLPLATSHDNVDHSNEETVKIDKTSHLVQSNASPQETMPRSRGGLLTFAEWNHIPNLRSEIFEFQEDEKRSEFIKEVLELVSSDVNNRRHFLRLIGPQGFGKTRLVLEAIRKNTLEDQCYYVSDPIFLASDILTRCIETATKPVILVVDNCTFHLYQSLKPIAYAKEQIRFIFIETKPLKSDEALFEEAFLLDHLPPHVGKLVEAFLDQHNLVTINDDKFSYYDEIARLGLNVLFKYFEIIINNEIEGTLSLLNFEYFNNLVFEDLESVKGLEKTIKALAILEPLSIYPQYHEAVNAVLDIIGVSSAQLASDTLELFHLGIVRRYTHPFEKQYSYGIRSHPLKVFLSALVWQANGSNILERILLSDNAEYEDLRLRLIRNLSELGNSEIAVPFVTRLLERFSTVENIWSATNEFIRLGEAAPGPVLERLDTLLDTNVEMSTLGYQGESLADFLKLAVRLEKYAIVGFKIFAKLVCLTHRAEHSSDNIIRDWSSLFYIRMGGSVLSGFDRLLLLQELYASEQVEYKIAVMYALDGVLTNNEFGAIWRSPGGYISGKIWVPETWKDFWDVRRIALKILREAIEDPNENVKYEAVNRLLGYASDQVPVLEEEILGLVQIVSEERQFNVNIWEAIHKIFWVSGDKLTDKAKLKFDKILESLTATFHDKLEIFLASDLSLLQIVKGTDADGDFLQSTISALVEEGHSQGLLLQEIGWSTTGSIFDNLRIKYFFQELGKIDSERAYVSALLSQSDLPTNIWSNYLMGRIQAGDLDWVLDWCKQSVSTYPHLIPVAAVIVMEHLQLDESWPLVSKYLSNNWINSAQFSTNWTNKITVTNFQRLIKVFLDNESSHNPRDVLNILYSRLEKSAESQEIDAIAIEVLEGLSPPEDRQSDGYWYYWKTLAQHLVNIYPLRILRVALNVFTTSRYIYAFEDEYWSIVRQAIKREPEKTWEEISSRILLDSSHTKYLPPFWIADLGLNELIPSEILINWCNQNALEGVRVLARIIKLTQPVLDELTRYLLIEYSHDKKILDTLTYGFVSLGVHETYKTVSLLQEKRELALSWKNDPDPVIREWAKKVSVLIEEGIAHSR